MTVDAQNMKRRVELQEELIASAAYKLTDRLRTFDLSLHIFQRNFQELEAAIMRHAPNDIMGLIRVTQNHQHRNEEQMEIVRLLHNFVAAAMSLVDHTRVFFTELYAEKNLIPNYQEQIRTIFAEDELVNFVKCLRQFCQHYRLPLVVTQVSIDVEKQVIQSGVSLRKTDLVHFIAWTKAAKAFLDKSPAEIELLDLVRSYNKKVTDFYDWFATKQREIHKAELEYYEHTMSELHNLGK